MMTRYRHSRASSSATSYDVTAGGERLSCSGPPPPVMLSVHQQHQDIRKRRVSPFSDDYEAMPSCDLANQAPQPVTMKVPSKRRKAASCGAGSAYDDDGEDSRSIRTLPDKKQNHSEIEKRRRDKMNTYITELAAIVPMCGAMARKLDKLTVLRMTAQHIRSVRGALSSCPLTACPRPAYVTEQELNELVLAAGREAFVLVVGCDRGRLLYVSASVTSMLHYDNSELLGQSIFDILHPKDVAKVKEQLSSSDLSPRERLIDAKTMLPVKADTGVGATRLCPGARRSFFCRIKTKTAPGPDAPSARGPQGPQIKEELDSGGKLRKKNERKYCVVQCTGYMKSWAPAEIEEAEAGGSGGEEEASNPSCLVAVGRALHHMIPAPPGAHRPRTAPLQYLSRHANDGKFLFVDPRVTLVLGFLPQELLGTSLYEYVSGPELAAVARAHKAALVQRDALRTTPYAVRCKDGSHALIQSHFKPFRNPWTKDVECLVAENTVITDAPPRSYDGLHHSENMAANAGGGCVSESDMEVQRLIDSQVESHKIGSAIAEEALRRSPNGGLSLDLPADMLHDALFSNNALVDTMLAEDANEMQVRNNVTLSEAAGDDRSPEEALGSPSSITMDGNGEAAMAVIMSLLEADAGLGGPVNFSGLPWPLP